jgi:hypothetical protein
MDTNTNNYIIEDIQEIKFKIVPSPAGRYMITHKTLSYDSEGFNSGTDSKLISICHTLKASLRVHNPMILVSKDD